MSTPRLKTHLPLIPSWVWLAATLGVAYLWTVYPALKIPFFLDDQSKIVHNPDVHSLTGVWGKLVYPYGPAMVSGRNDPSRPLVYLLYTVMYAGFGEHPLPFHVLNLALHLLNGGLFALFLARLITTLQVSSNPRLAAVMGAGFFLLMPINLGTVAYVYGLSDVLSLTWVLCALLSQDERTSHPRLGVWGVNLSIALGLCSKQMGVITPVLLIFYDVLVGGYRHGASRKVHVWSEALRRNGLSLCLVGLYLVWRFYYFGKLGDIEGSIYVKPLLPYALAQGHAIWLYISGSFWPGNLCLDHDLPYPLDNWGLHLFKTLALMMAGFGGLLLLARKTFSGSSRLALFGLVLFLVWLAPTSSFMPTVDYVVERRVYGGTIGLVMLVLAGGAWLSERLRAVPWSWLVMSLIVACYGLYLAVSSHSRLVAMQDEKNLWLGVLAQYPLSHRALGNLANAYTIDRKFDEAEYYYQRILAILPDHARTYVNLGFLYAALWSPRRDLSKAKTLLHQGLGLNPEVPEAWYHLGLLHLESLTMQEAEQSFQRVISLDPRHVDAYNQLCALLLDQGRKDEALFYLNRAKELMPSHPMVRENMARLSSAP